MRQFVAVAVLAVIIGLSSVAVAQDSPHYVNGVEGIKAATLPPPGNYFRIYSVGYTAQKVRTNSGSTAHVDFDVSVAAVATRFIKITETKILGANYGFDVLVPVIYTDIDAFGVVRDSETGIGDVWIEPLLLAWHGQQYDAAIGMGFYMPTGQYSQRRAASPGKDHWTAMATAGYTQYFDEAKTWSASILARYETHSTKRNAPIHSGDDFHFEWGVAKSIMPGIDVGFAGYAQWQVTDDKGAGVRANPFWNGSRHDQIFAAGPEISTAFPEMGLFVSLRVLQEFAVRNAPEGLAAVLTVTKAF